MNILFVSAVLPYPLYSGGQIRIYNLLKTLSKKHRITLFSFIRNEGEERLLNNLSFCQKVVTVTRGHAWQPKYMIPAVLGKYPLLLSSYNSGEMRNKLEAEIKTGNYNLMHIEPGYVWPSLPVTNLPLVVSEHNIESEIYEDYVKHFRIIPLRPLLYADVLKLKYWEKEIWNKAQGLVTVSESDASVIASKMHGQRTAIVPNGIDPGIFQFRPKAKVSQPPVFLFVGNFSWLQNRDALGFLLRKLWPAITVQFPEASLKIVGRSLPRSLKNLANIKNVFVLDNVTDINTQYLKSDIMLAPIRIGGGTKFKILEAMAAGLPVITTTKGIEGLSVESGREVLVAGNPDELVKLVQEILSSNNFRMSLVTNARKKVEKDYTWENISLKLDKLWKEVYG